MALPIIVLASTSRYRCELMQRLRLPFQVVAPGVDEAALPAETPRATALRLAEEKAAAVAREHPAAIVIGSDQIAELDGAPLGKPHDHETALNQLTRMQGRPVIFHTAVAVQAAGRVTSDSVPTTVTFRQLSTAQLDAYLRADEPYDCAGAAKIEALGIALVERVESTDPTALIGLPLIRLTSMLRDCGVEPLA
jgi:septum formation protein